MSKFFVSLVLMLSLIAVLTPLVGSATSTHAYGTVASEVATAQKDTEQQVSEVYPLGEWDGTCSPSNCTSAKIIFTTPTSGTWVSPLGPATFESETLVPGEAAKLTFTDGEYTATNQVTLSTDGDCMSGVWNDGNGASGTVERCWLGNQDANPSETEPANTSEDGQAAEIVDIRVVSAQLSPDAPEVGDIISVSTTVVNFGSSAGESILEVKANNMVVATQSVALNPQESKSVRFTFIPQQAGPLSVEVGGVEQLINVTGGESGIIRVGPTVRLSANKVVITEDEDAIIDLFWDNSALNEVSQMIEVTVDVPSGLYLFSQQGGMACAAGTCKGLFTAPPGSVRNLPLIIKADQKGEYFIHLLGRYWPEGNPDQWNPMSLNTPITVKEVSPEPEVPEPTNPDQVPTEVVGTISGGAGSSDGFNRFLTFPGIAVVSILAIVIIVLGSYWAIRAFRPDISIGPLGDG